MHNITWLRVIGNVHVASRICYCIAQCWNLEGKQVQVIAYSEIKN
jgi:hypothetical protein